MQSEGLKPCPFCGHSAHIEQRGDQLMSTIYQCDDCGCRLETGEERDYGVEWNRRSEAALSTEECQYSKDNNIPEHRCAVRCVYKGEAALSTDAEPVKLSDDERRIGVIRSSVETGNDGKPDSRVSVKQYQDNDSLITISMFMGNHQWIEGSFTAEDAAKIASVIIAKPAVAPLYAEPVKTAPAVAVKALEWYVYENGECTATSVIGKYNIDLLDGVWYIYFNRATTPLANFGTVEKAKSAAQSHYEARIRSALSAQVQDVAEKPLSLGALRNYFMALREADLSWSEMPTALYTYLLMDGYVSVKAAKEQIRSELSASPASKHGDAE